MNSETNLERFAEAQKATYQRAFAEVASGRKQSHWMWFIFPQLQGLGFSEISNHYAIKNLEEAEAFLKHPLLGSRLRAICNELLQLKTNDAHKVFGSPDNLKLKSSMTLFGAITNPDPVFQAVLNKFFGGEKDDKTLRLLER